MDSKLNNQPISIENNLGLVHAVLKSLNMSTKQPNYEDLYQEGCIGLIKAVNTYNYKCAFSSYAWVLIRNEIFMASRHEKKINIISINEPIRMDNNGHELTCEDILVGDKDINYDFELLPSLISLIPDNWKHKDFYIEFLSNKLNNNKRTQMYYSEKYNLSQAHINRMIQKLYKHLKAELTKW